MASAESVAALTIGKQNTLSILLKLSREHEKQQPPHPRYPTLVSIFSVPLATSAQIILLPVIAPALRRPRNSPL